MIEVSYPGIQALPFFWQNWGDKMDLIDGLVEVHHVALKRIEEAPLDQAHFTREYRLIITF